MTEDAKINQLLFKLPKGAVVLSSWLVSEGYSYELQQRYRKSGWFTSIGRGAMIRSGDSLILSAAISALQIQSNMSVHIGGRSALGLLGLAHYLEVNVRNTTLFGARTVKLPDWIKNNKWDTEPTLYHTTILNTELGLVDYTEGNLSFKISGAARAIMECLSLCPLQFSISEAYELMEGLNMLRPAHVQELLEQCSSIKVKRLFMYFAEKANHSWFKYINTNHIDLGSGKRSLAKNGMLTSKYQLILPKELL